EVEFLAQRHIQGANTATYRGSQWPLDGHEVLADNVKRFLWQPVASKLKRLFTGKYFPPMYLAGAVIGLFYRSIEDAYRRCPNIGSGTISFDKRYNWISRNQDSIG